MNRNLSVWITYFMYGIILVSVNLSSKVHLGNTLIYYISAFSLIGISLYCFIKDKRFQSWSYIFPILYIIWAIIGIFRGIFEIKSYFVFNQYIHGIIDVLVPISVFLFASPWSVLNVFQKVNIFMIVFAFGSFGWNFTAEAYVFCLTPFYYLYSCFLFKIPRKWRFLTICALIFVFLALDNKSGIIKSLVSFGALFVFLLPDRIRNIGVHIGHWFFYIGAFTLLYLGFSGKYNVFSGNSAIAETPIKVITYPHYESTEKSSRIDTRTFIYEEMIFSAIEHNHFLIGRTPARGYSSPSFAKDVAENGSIPSGIDFDERHGSEVANLNTFNWLGLIGLVLLTLVFIQGTSLALYTSNNIYLKCIAMGVAFQWAYGWVENVNQFLMLDLMIYIMLALCYSPYFRKMSNIEFELWFKSIFTKPGETTQYQRYKIIKYLILLKLELAINKKKKDQPTVEFCNN